MNSGRTIFAQLRMQFDHSLYSVSQILSVSLFEKTELLQALTEFERQNHEPQPSSQFARFNLRPDSSGRIRLASV